VKTSPEEEEILRRAIRPKRLVERMALMGTPRVVVLARKEIITIFFQEIALYLYFLHKNSLFSYSSLFIYYNIISIEKEK